MSWIDRELRRRQKLEAKQRDGNSMPPAAPGAGSTAARIATLWGRFEAANDALPEELRLARKTPANGRFAPEHAMFQVFLQSSNGAGIGFTGDAVRYVWPKPNMKKSNNFWIRCQPEAGYLLGRRVGPSLAEPRIVEREFDERSVDRIMRRLVTAKRVTWRSVRKRRFWLF